MRTSFSPQNRTRFTVTAAVAALLFCSSPLHAATAKVTLKVIEEEDKPLSGAHAYASFTSKIESDQGRKSKTKAKEGKTGEDGLFTAEQDCDEPRIWYGATLPGYYRTSLEYSFDKVVEDRWEPWSPEFKVLLRKIRNPLPMFAKKVQAVIPETGKKLGYDLEKGDWVVPYGEGKTSDFLFLFSGRFASFGDREEKIELSFPGEHDGIIELTEDPDFAGSEFRVPYEAPEKGYKKTWEREKSIVKGGVRKNLEKRQGQHFIFRVRSSSGKDGLQSAKYGKIRGDIEFGYLTGNVKEPQVAFTYYLNPNGTRGLEFSRDKNLLEGLKPSERVSAP